MQHQRTRGWSGAGRGPGRSDRPAGFWESGGRHRESREEACVRFAQADREMNADSRSGRENFEALLKEINARLARLERVFEKLEELKREKRERSSDQFWRDADFRLMVLTVLILVAIFAVRH